MDLWCIAGGYKAARSSSGAAIASPSASTEEMQLFKKTNKVPQPLAPPTASNKESASANNVTLSYRNGATPAAADDATPRSQRPKNRINSLTGTRERIAQMIGRK